MLFNSIEFLVWFLPVTLAGVYVFGRARSTQPAIFFLIVASLIFYGWNRSHDLLILLPSVLGNFFLGGGIEWLQNKGRRRLSALLLGLGVTADLALIGYFKYADFAFHAFTQVTTPGTAALHAGVLPLGISFFTFQQIKFLVDRYRRHTPQPNFFDYVLFVVFFPHVIAGPIVHHDNLIPQFREHRIGSENTAAFFDGFAFFLLGLSKKTILADQFGAYADTGFGAAAHGSVLTFFASWAAVLSYTFQIYFDFSGYSDMAFGLAKMCGLAFPINFNSPYKAKNIIEFWRRWHITLSTFLRDHLYIPLGGNRHGRIRRYGNLLLTMAIGGLWHGAGWTFVAWGVLHGCYLIINHAWHYLRRHLRLDVSGNFFGRVVAHTLTFLSIVVAWVFFRASSFHSATDLLLSMVGQNGSQLPSQLIAMVPPLHWVASGVGKVNFLGDETVMGFVELVFMLAIGFAATLCCPNLYEVGPNRRRLLILLTFAFTMQKVFFSASPSSFIYFRF